ncbi:TPA: hypothetical protein BOS_3824 [Bos taurus]|nr:TPA: hypothetical protein BOS_3824 [Bos taurus]
MVAAEAASKEVAELYNGYEVVCSRPDVKVETLDGRVISVSSEDLPSVPPTMRLNVQEETGRIIEMQRLEIQRLRDQIQEQEQVPGFHPLAGMQLPSLSGEDLKAQTK